MWPCSRQCKCWVVVCLTTRQIDFPKLFWCCLWKKWTYNFCNKTYRIYLSTTGSAISQCADTLVSCKEKTFVPAIEKSHTVWLIRERRGVQHNNAREEHLSFILPGSLTKPLKRRHASCPVLLPVVVRNKYVSVVLLCGLCSWCDFGRKRSVVFVWISTPTLPVYLPPAGLIHSALITYSWKYQLSMQLKKKVVPVLVCTRSKKTKTNKQSRVYMLLSSHVSTSFLSCRCIRGGKDFDEKYFYRLQPQGATGSQAWREGGGSCGDGSLLLRWTGEEQYFNVGAILHQCQVTATK